MTGVSGPFAGTMISEAAFPNLPVLYKRAGLDFIIIDCEHGAFDWATLSAMLMNARLAEILAIVRLPDNGRASVTRLMDMGAAGLLLPMTNRPEDICRVVEYAMYAPIGHRGISTTRAHTLYDPPELHAYMAGANARTMIFAQIETREGLSAVADVLAVPGVFGAMVGPNDLACDLDAIGDEAPILEAIDRVAATAREAGKASGVITANERFLRRAHAAGMAYFSIGSELNMLKSGAGAVAKKLATL